MCVIRLVVGGTNMLDQTMIYAFHYFISSRLSCVKINACYISAKHA